MLTTSSIFVYFLLQVERIVDKRKNKKGKWEYLIRWKGYESKEDTWEPEHHLLHCEEFIDQFNSLNLQDRHSKSSKSNTQPRVHDPSKSHRETRKKKRTSATGGSGLGSGPGPGSGPGVPPKPRKISGGKASGDRISKPISYQGVKAGLQFVPHIRAPSNGLQNGEMNTLHYRTTARTQGVPSSRVERIVGDVEKSKRAVPPVKELGKAALFSGFSWVWFKKLHMA